MRFIHIFLWLLLTDTLSAYDIDVRLVDGYNIYEGRVEIYYMGEWGTVYSMNWDMEDAHVVCKQLGFGSASGFFQIASPFAGGSGPTLEWLNCTGQESELADCEMSPSWDTVYPNEFHYFDAAVECRPKADTAPEGSLRLVDGSSGSEGRLEVRHSDSWGTVCDLNWDLKEAEVVCRQLGFTGALGAENNARYGQGAGLIVFAEIECSGLEGSIIDCDHEEWYIGDSCSHSDDAGVSCIPPEMYTPRLVNGSQPYEGRVEIWTGTQWERLCRYHNDVITSDLICRELGYDGAIGIDDEQSFGEGDKLRIGFDFDCNGTYDFVAECPRRTTWRYTCSGAALSCNGGDGEEKQSIVWKVFLYSGIAVSAVLSALCKIGKWLKAKEDKETCKVHVEGERNHQPQPTNPQEQSSTGQRQTDSQTDHLRSPANRSPPYMSPDPASSGDTYALGQTARDSQPTNTFTHYSSDPQQHDPSQHQAISTATQSADVPSRDQLYWQI